MNLQKQFQLKNSNQFCFFFVARIKMNLILSISLQEEQFEIEYPVTNLFFRRITNDKIINLYSCHILSDNIITC
jgi:hypothetical protein